MTEATATGTFTVELVPIPGASPVVAMSIRKTFGGDLEGTSEGQMLSYGDPRSGAAGYVAIERVEGVLGRRKGTFAVQHSGTLDAQGQHLVIAIVPGSGTGDLTGISGDFDLRIAEGAHHYTLRYHLPQ